MAEVVSFDDYLRRAQRSHAARRSNRPLFFDRRELQQLVGLYSENVMAGEWRDYAIDHRDGMALFSIFRSSNEQPLYVVSKRLVGPGVFEYLVFDRQRRAARAGNLKDALAYLRRKLTVVTQA